MGIRDREDRLVCGDGDDIRRPRPARSLVVGHRLLAAAAVVTLTSANLRGIHRTALVARVLLGATLLTLGVVIIVCTAGEAGNPDAWRSGDQGGLPGVLQAAGLFFFAFAGFVPMATLAEEVRSPHGSCGPPTSRGHGNAVSRSGQAL